MYFSERRPQRGSAAIEFVLVFGTFLAALLAMIDFSRWLFAVNSAHEAAREGARVAVVCDKNDTAVQSRMAPFLATATGGTITVSYSPNACTVTNCEGVTVSLSGYHIDSIAPFMPIALNLPTAKTFLSRESMDSTLNARCS
jgi:Flp pilus assembly protein TadG